MPIGISLSDDALWLPVSDEEIEEQVKQNTSDGLALSLLWFRVRLYNKDAKFLHVLREQMEAQPENIVIQAAFVRAVIPFRFGMTFGGQKPRRDVVAEFADVDLRELIEKGKRKDPKCWLMYVAESEWIPGSGYGDLKTMRTDAVDVAQKAYDLEANPVTIKQLAWASFAQAWSESKPESLPIGKSFIELNEKLYPWSADVNTSFYQLYAFVPSYADKEKAAKAKEVLLSTIPQNLRNTKPILDYLNWIEWDKR